MTILLANMLLGLSIALPVGTVTIEMTKQGLKNGFVHGWVVGLGGMTVDLLFIILLYYGLASVLSTPAVQLVMWLVGAIFLLYIGFSSMKEAAHDVNSDGKPVKKSLLSSYISGFLVAISPGNLFFWLSVFGTVLTTSFQKADSLHFLFAAIGILSGILIHDLGLMTIVAGTRKVLKPSYMKWISVFAGILLIGFSLYFFGQFVQQLIIYL
ncbi:LysE family translocator [Priestia koreensis]|uniref:LysE family translocator n=1 Tax=Priestia koreensis TaxID=284581 RepID=UPI003D05BE97